MAKQTRRKRRTTSVRSNETVTVNTTGGAVRISEPTTKPGRTSAKEKAAVVVDVVTPRAVEGFFGFLRANAVVGVGVGLVIGTQLKAIIDSLNNGFINPLFGLLFDGGELNKQISVVHYHGREATLAWGQVAYQVINFIFVMIVIYAIIKLLKLDKLDLPKK